MYPGKGSAEERNVLRLARDGDRREFGAAVGTVRSVNR